MKYTKVIIGIIFISLIVVTVFIINPYLKSLGVLLLGIAIGFVMQRSRFCIASAFNDFVLFRDSSLLKAVLIFIFVSTIGFSFIQATGKEGYIVAIGWRTMVGALLFGFGMAIAGSCAVGTLMRIGEGYVLFIFALFGLVIGGASGAYHYDYWGSIAGLSYTVFLPNFFGGLGAVGIQLIVLLIIFSILCFFYR